MVCLAAAMAGACDPEPSTETPCHDRPAQPASRGAHDDLAFEPGDSSNPCPPTGCAGNSPLIAGVYFWRLHLPLQAGPGDGQENPEGIRIVDVRAPDGNPMQLRLLGGDSLVGIKPPPSAGMLEAGALVGTRITVAVPSQDGTPPKEYQIRIEEAAREPFWIDANRHVVAYNLAYSSFEDPDHKEPQPLCSDAVNDPDPNKIHALVFGGESYDRVTKKIAVGAFDDGWINIACAGGAPYKMHHVGHTLAAGNRLDIETTPSQRQAMLNAWTSNVCGNGEAFTIQGEPITLRDSLGVVDISPYNEDPESIEAIWDEDGAVCLNVPRRYAEDDEPLCTAIEQSCRRLPPPCTAEQIENWMQYGHVLTGNRP